MIEIKGKEKRWKCAAPNCKEMFSSNQHGDDRYFCQRHQKEKKYLTARVSYHFKKTHWKYYKKKRAKALHQKLLQCQKIEADLVRMLQLNRGKQETVLVELEGLEKAGVRER